MANAYIAEIRIFTGNFAPKGWALCNGQLLSVAQNTPLFALIGANFGGNGTSTFALPNLQGCVPMHWGNGAGLTPRIVGETGGQSAVTLIPAEVAAHGHAWNCGAGSKGENSTVTNQLNADEATGGAAIYATASDGSTMNAGTLQPSPPSLPHDNMQPYLAFNFIIALTGIFPPRS